MGPHMTSLPLDAIDLAVDLGGVSMPNPITTASGCFASGREIDRFWDVDQLGALVVKSITLEPREGLPTPRMHETPSGMLNAIGLQNPGIDAWIEKDLSWLTERGVRTIASVAGDSVGDFAKVTRRLHEAGGVTAIEINLSCPNVEHRGLVFACHAHDAAEVMAAVRAETDLPLFAKLTSDVTDVVAIAEACLEAGSTGLSLINTLLGMAIDPWTGKPRIANTYGGLSGPAIRPVAIRNVHQVHQAYPDVPIIGMGGVRRVEDVIEFIRAGATAVAIGTAGFAEPFLGRDLIDELRRWLADRGVRRVSELHGVVEPW